jgi:hypothetical protein
MAISVTAAQVRLAGERRFFTGMALSMAAVAFAGFARTYYLAGFHDAPTPVLTPWIHVHGALCSVWVLLLIVQTRLIAAGQRATHALLGSLGAVVAAATFITGIYVAIHSQRRVHTATTADTLADPYVFLIFPFTSVCLFALFVVLGVARRHHAEAHKRLMLLATANLIIPALARIVTQVSGELQIVGVPGVVGAVILLNVFLVAMAIHDLSTRGKLHPVTLWGGGFVLLSEPLRFVIGFSAPWQAFAQAVTS